MELAQECSRLVPGREALGRHRQFVPDAVEAGRVEFRRAIDHDER
jgi:hypothetical protein